MIVKSFNQKHLLLRHIILSYKDNTLNYTKKNNFAEEFKNLTRYKSKNNFI